MRKLLTKMLLTSAILSALLTATSCVYAQATDDNIALHQKVTITPNPNYSFTPDRNPQQLTDGIYASTKDGKWDPDPKKRAGHLWTRKGGITWVHQKPIITTIDLGKVQPISGVIYSTGGGVAGVGWPDHIYIATSDDNQTWHYAGDLVLLSQRNDTPPNTGDVTFRYITHDLKTHGRYVALGVMQDTFIVTDEVEVLRGDDSLLNLTAGPEIPSMATFVAQETITMKARQRQNEDIASIRALIGKSALSAQQKNIFTARLDKDAAATEDMAPLSTNFKTIIPLTDIHRDILAVHGEALAAQGIRPLTVWKQHRYAWLPLINTPNKQSASLNFGMLKNQIRTDAILLTNASGQPMTVNIQLQDAPIGAQNGWLQLASAIWTDTYAAIPVQDALIPLDPIDGVYSLKIPAGLTGKLWVTVDTSKVPTGVTKSTFIVSGMGQRISVPLNVDVSKIVMPVPRMSLTVWDYTDGKGSYGITPENREAAIKLMRSHFVDSPWAKGWTFPTPKESDFDANNQLVSTMDFSTFDQWINMWPNARNYMIFRNVRDTDDFAGAKMGTPEFNARVGSWIKVIVAHALTLGVKPSQLVICPVDETRSDENDAHLLAWGKAIKAAVPQIRLFSDPIWRDPAKAKYQEAYEFVDILSPHPNWENDFYVHAAQKNQKQELWLYNGPGLNSTGDPQLAYRQMAWRVFAAGGQGMGFWAFGDLSGAKSSWNTYTATKLIYAPAFIGEKTVDNSVHWDAVRDGVTDFEELSMLKDAINKSNNSVLRTQAQEVLDAAVKAANALTSQGSIDDDPGVYDWNKDHDPTVVDVQLAKVRAMLERLDN